MAMGFKEPELNLKSQRNEKLKLKTLQKLSEILINVIWGGKEAFTISLFNIKETFFKRRLWPKLG